LSLLINPPLAIRPSFLKQMHVLFRRNKVFILV